MFDPAMLEAAQAMMRNMSPEQLASMQNMARNMDPNLVQSMMQNRGATTAPQVAQNAHTAAPPKTLAQKLADSPLQLDEQTIQAAEQAETLKQQGNQLFKTQTFDKAIKEYQTAISTIDGLLHTEKVTGNDEKAVLELLDACRLNAANCSLKLEQWQDAIDQCEAVLERGPNRKALFRRGQALVKLGKRNEALVDLRAAVKMDPADKTVSAMLAEVQAAVGTQSDDDDDDDEEEARVEEIEHIDTSHESAAALPPQAASASPRMPPGMPTKADGTPDYGKMQEMIDQISPEQMKAQAEAIGRMDPSQLQAMGIDASQVQAVSQMMSSMDPQTMKNMSKMAAQMGAAGLAPPPPPTAGAAKLPAAAAASAAVTEEATSAAPAGPDAAQLREMMSSMGQGGGAAGAADMLSKLSPEMIEASMDMMKNMDPKMLAGMCGSMGMDEARVAQMQQAMSSMSPEDLKKWTGRAAKVAKVAQVPMRLYRGCTSFLGGSVGALALLTVLLAVMCVGHFTEYF